MEGKSNVRDEIGDGGFEIGAAGIDCQAIVSDIRAAVERKRRDGLYDDSRIALAERHNLDNLRGNETFFERYIECLREAVLVDINDFDINERRRFARPLAGVKRLLWKMLKFYTYRLWSQQNQVNALLLTAVDETARLYSERIEKLQARIAALENRGSET